MTTHKLEILVIGRDKASGPLSGVKGALGGIGTVAGGILAAGIFTGIARGFMDMASGAASFVKESIFAAGRVEEMSAVLKTLEKNQGLAAGTTDLMIDNIKELGITTQSAQWVTAQFVRWQLKSEQATDLARLAQDAAVISMQDSSDALQGLMHGITTMNTRVLRTYGITLASTVTAQDAYAESLGKTRAELNETEKIQAVLNAVLEQGEQISGAYEAAMDTAGKQMRSMKRHVIELMNSIGTPLLGAFSSVIGMMTNFLKGMRHISEEGGVLRRFFEAIGRVLDQLFGSLEKADFGFDTFGDHIANILNPIIDVIDNFGTLLAIINSLGVDSKTFAFALEQMFGPDVAGFILGAIDLFRQIQTFIGGIGEKATAFGEIAGPIFTQIGEALLPLWDAVKNLFSAFVESGPQAAESGQTFLDWILNNLVPTIENFVLNLSIFLNNMAEFWRIHGEEIIEGLRVAFATIVAIFTGVYLVLTGIWAVFTSILKGDWKAAWEVIKTTIETIAQNILTIVGSSLEELRQNWEDIFNMIVEIVVAIATKLYNAGRDAIQGLWNGIKSMWSRMKAWIDRQIQAVLDAFNRILGLGSPSKVLAQYGRWMMEGLAQGINDGASAPEMAMAGVGAGVLAKGPGQVGGGGAGTTVYIQVDGAREPEAVVDEIMRRLRRQGITLGQ